MNDLPNGIVNTFKNNNLLNEIEYFDGKKLRNDVNVLKKTCLYVPGRVKSATSSENNFYRLKLDEARNNKKKSQEAFNQLNKKLEELKSEAKFINDDNNPYVKRIKLLENKLDKAIFK